MSKSDARLSVNDKVNVAPAASNVQTGTVLQEHVASSGPGGATVVQYLIMFNDGVRKWVTLSQLDKVLA